MIQIQLTPPLTTRHKGNIIYNANKNATVLKGWKAGLSDTMKAFGTTPRSWRDGGHCGILPWDQGGDVASCPSGGLGRRQGGKRTWVLAGKPVVSLTGRRLLYISCSLNSIPSYSPAPFFFFQATEVLQSKHRKQSVKKKEKKKVERSEARVGVM